MTSRRETFEDTTAIDVCPGASPGELAVILGPNDGNRRLIEGALGVKVRFQGGGITVRGGERDLLAAQTLFDGLLEEVRGGRTLTGADVRRAAQQAQQSAGSNLDVGDQQQIILTARGKPVRPKTAGQQEYVDAVQGHDLTFCIGPAGTGKTYLAMALAVAFLRSKNVTRIVLTRPIVQAGEELGFLPGDMMDKVDPYLRPLHDALHDILGGDRFRRYMERRTIEVIPLAYMRGRTLNSCFVVLDEAQNTTPGQMKMALTRLGFGSKMIVTGDITQSDLPTSHTSGLQDALGILDGIEQIAVCRLTRDDIVRHDLVQRIVAAYGDDSVETRVDST